MLLKISTLALLPAIIVQGYRVKKNTPRLPEPQGERQGVLGQGQSLSLLILGDSAAVGVGVTQQQDALLGAVLTELAPDYQVRYRLEAKTGDNTAQILAAARALAPQAYDVIVTSVGVNDVTRFRDPAKWIMQQQRLYAELEQRFRPKMILISAVPPMEQFPALKPPLGWLFGRYAGRMNGLLADFVGAHADSTVDYQLLKYDVAHYKQLNIEMAADGFHPSQAVYQLWGKEIAGRVRQQFSTDI